MKKTQKTSYIILGTFLIYYKVYIYAEKSLPRQEET